MGEIIIFFLLLFNFSFCTSFFTISFPFNKTYYYKKKKIQSFNVSLRYKEEDTEIFIIIKDKMREIIHVQVGKKEFTKLLSKD